MTDRLPGSNRLRLLKTLPVAPTLLTAGNLACGITAILCAAHDQLLAGAVLIFAAMICDMFDGKVARLTKQDGPFGAELDSLSDVVSFGVAPAILVHRLVLGSPGVFDPGMRILWFLTVFYPVMAAIRLARYNVEHAQPAAAEEAPAAAAKGGSHFRGIPSPGAAAVVASLIILHQNQPEWLQHLVYSPPRMVGYQGLLTLDGYRWFLLATMAVCALLMVSTIRYPHVGSALFGRISFGKMIVGFLLVALLVYNLSLMLAVGTVGYLLYGLIGAGWRGFKRLRQGRDPIEDEDEQAAEDLGLSHDQPRAPDGPAHGR